MSDVATIIAQFHQLAIWFFICFFAFAPLSFVAGNIQKQQIVRKGFFLDVLYWFAQPFFQSFLSFLVVSAVGSLLFAQGSDALTFRTYGFRLFLSLSLWGQLFIVLFLTNFIQYWNHRLFHRHLWKFHAIHHSPREVDWLTTARFHPLNAFFQGTLIGLLVYTLGFSPVVFVMQYAFYTLFGALVHANLNWTFGWFGYIIASPVFHRWHHTLANEGGEKNFAPVFPITDLLFGTFYMPKGILPSSFGTQEEIPENIFAQLIYPFRRSAK